MKNQFSIKSCLAVFTLAAAAQTSVQAQTFNPIALTPSSFTECMVIPTNWTYKLNAQSISVTIDHGPTLQTDTVSGFPTYYSLDSGDCFFEIGMERTSATTLTYGIPAGGSLLTNVSLSASTQLHYYQLPYWTNYNSNCICIAPYINGNTYNSLPLTGGPYVGQSYNTNINLALNTTTSYTALSLLCSSGGPFSNLVTIAYADGTVQQNVAFTVPNWFVNAATYTAASGYGPTASFAYTCSSRCNAAENQNSFAANSGVTSGSRLWSVDIALTDTTSYPTNLSFSANYINAGTTAATVIYAVSGSTNPSDNSKLPNTAPLTGPFSPVSVSGFNAGSVVANSPQTLAGLYPLTATMDNGTNLAGGANTWFEKGWDQAQPTNGFPNHGTTIASGAHPTFTYQLPASYNGSMCVLVDVNHQSNNITPLNTNVSYTAFTLLTAGASISSGKQMSNYIILQHADGVNESNTFIGYDWFESTVIPAWSGAERCNIGGSTSITGREVASLEGVDASGNGSPPFLFDSEFPMQDGTPVTNIVVGYRQAPAANSTTYVIAVSATTNFIALQTPISYTPAQNVFAGQTAVFTVTNYVGTLPSYQWQVSDGVSFTNNLNNGPTGTGSTISGATTPTLTIANVGPSDTNYLYTCLLSNSAPSTANSPLVVLTLRVSTAANVVQPNDPISDFFGSSYTPGEAYPSPAGLTVNYVIDGTDEQYLNYGASGGNTSFQGPVGIIVQPSAGSTIVNAVRFIVAVNAAVCDPADFSLDGSENGVNWTNIVPDQPLALPNPRNLVQSAPVNITNQVLQEVDFPNTTNYSYYRVTIQNTKGGGSYNSMQIGELQFLGVLAPIPPEILTQPFPLIQELRAGGSVTWSFVARGVGPITNQWYQIANGVPSMIPGATNNSLTLSAVTTGMSGNLYYCKISNPYGFVTTDFVKLVVETGALNQYATAVLGDNPIAFFPLDEATNNPPVTGNDGTIAYDIFGGHDGVYSNTVLHVTGISAGESDDFAAEFGTLIDPNVYANPQPSATLPQDNLVAGIEGINFGTPTNTTTNFSVEAWVNLNSDTLGGAGIIAQGWGGGETFAMDMGGTGNAFRFYFRTAGTNSIPVSPNVTPSNSVWYHVVGVLTEGPTNVSDYIYINGQLAASNGVNYTNTTGAGVFATNATISIGARQSGTGTNYNLQLNGSMADVAIYNYALTSNQISNHFVASLEGPGILIQPTPLVQNLQVGGSVTWSALAYGPGPITYQWFQVTGSAGSLTTNLISGATGTNFTLIDATASADYFCTASNPNGSTNTIEVMANVLASTSAYVTTILADDPIAFLRLDEGPNNPPNNGVTAYDTVGSHNGYYSNTILQVQGYSTNDSDDYAAQFGSLSDPLYNNLAQDNLVAGINGLNFFSPTNTDKSLSVEAWVYLYNSGISGAGIVAKGYGGGGEEFALDTGGTAEAFRFYFRTVGGGSLTVSPNVAPFYSVWYHVVGVLYESNNVAYEYLYTNGVLGATTITTFASPPGILSNDVAPVSIGSRQSASTTNYNLQLDGVVANVAIYPYALSAAQVGTHYLASGIAPVFTEVPTNTTVLEGQAGPAVFYSMAYGTSNAISPLVYQWSYNGVNLVNGTAPTGTGAVVSGVNTPNLTLSGFTPGDNGETFTLTVTNLYGAITAQASLTVASGSPNVVVDVQSPIAAFAGTPVTIFAIFDGALPFNYQWTYNGSPLANSARVSGVNSNVLTISPTVLADSGTYQLIVGNTVGTNTSSQAVLTVLPTLTFNDLGGSWSFNKSVAAGYNGGYISPNTLQLTDGAGNEALSSFFSNRVYVGAFQATFTYTDVGGNSGVTDNADGTCFVLQNSPSGAAALGGGGGGFGYTGITPSVAFQINLYQNSTYGGTGVDFAENGVDAETLNTYPLLVDSGNPINVTITYLNGTITALLQDTVADTSFSTTVAANISTILGTNMAFVGITGADGGSTSVQQVANFQFIPLPSVTAKISSGNIVLSWPTGTGAYQLESRTNLASGTWMNVTNAPAVTNNQNQVSVPLSVGPEFFRLELQ